MVRAAVNQGEIMASKSVAGREPGLRAALATIDSPAHRAKVNGYRRRHASATSRRDGASGEVSLVRLVARARANERLAAAASDADGPSAEASRVWSHFVVKVKQRTSLAQVEKRLAENLLENKSLRPREVKKTLAESGVRVEEVFPGMGAVSGGGELAKFFVIKLAVPAESLAPSAFDVAYEIRRRLDFELVEPRVSSATPSSDARLMMEPGDDGGLGDIDDIGNMTPRPAPVRGFSVVPNAFDCGWSLFQMSVPHALNAVDSTVPIGPRGEGILIAMPDTGWYPHPDVNPGIEINADLQRNLLEWWVPNHAIDLMNPLTSIHRGHGTSCASIAVSRGGVERWDLTKPISGTNNDGQTPNQPDKRRASRRVAGVAPAAQVIPIRCTNQVVNVLPWDVMNVANAIVYATAVGADVISISLGIPTFFLELEVAARFALSRNSIIVAAAAQVYPFIPWPAATDGVIAVTGSTRTGTQGGNRGPKVEIAAPALHVWHAFFQFDWFRPPAPIREPASAESDVVPTSFSTAAMAGVVALWLSHHGKENLRAQYPNTPLSVIFRSLLPQSVTTPRGWDTSMAGPGIINVQKLLKAPLPPPDSFRSRTAAAQLQSPTLLHVLSELCPTVETGELLSRFSYLFGTSAAETEQALEEFGPELLAMLGSRPPVYKVFCSDTASSLSGSAEEVTALLEPLQAAIDAYGSEALCTATAKGYKTQAR